MFSSCTHTLECGQVKEERLSEEVKAMALEKKRTFQQEKKRCTYKKELCQLGRVVEAQVFLPIIFASFRTSFWTGVKRHVYPYYVTNFAENRQFGLLHFYTLRCATITLFPAKNHNEKKENRPRHWGVFGINHPSPKPSQPFHPSDSLPNHSSTLDHPTQIAPEKHASHTDIVHATESP